MIKHIITLLVHIRVSHFCTLRTTPSGFLTVSGGVPRHRSTPEDGWFSPGARGGWRGVGGVESPLNNVFFGAFDAKPSHDLVHGGAKSPYTVPPRPPPPHRRWFGNYHDGNPGSG